MDDINGRVRLVGYKEAPEKSESLIVRFGRIAMMIVTPWQSVVHQMQLQQL